MKKTLIKTNNSLILVSDEEIKDDDYCYYKNGELEGVVQIKDGSYPKTMVRKKVLSQSPKLSKEVADEIGFVDVEELANEMFNEVKFKSARPAHFELRREIDTNNIIKGFKKANELNQKKYSEKDIINSFKAGMLWIDKYQNREHSSDWKDTMNLVQYIKSLSQPQQWQVEAKEIDGVWNVTKIIK